MLFGRMVTDSEQDGDGVSSTDGVLELLEVVVEGFVVFRLNQLHALERRRWW